MVNVAIMGHGVVGSGVAEILIKHKELIKQKAQREINIKYILDLRDFDVDYKDKFTKNFEDIINDESVQVVAEVMGGTEPAHTYVKRCLEKGKSVVTSNKELIAVHGAELIKIARDNNVNLLFEASVGGGIPVIRPMAQCLLANEIDSVTGILNGTTNFILNKMIMENLDFATALKIAQDKGYAEKNPDADILGIDTCRKVCILASLAFGKHVYPEQVTPCGITKVTLDDIDYADKLNCVIKLIGRSVKLKNGKITATVYPALVPKTNILSDVNGVFNAVVVHGDSTGDVMFYGKGAGKAPTASAVVADMIDCVKHLSARKYLFWDDGNADYVEKQENVPTKFFVYLTDVQDDIFDRISKVFGDDIRFLFNKVAGEFVFITKTDTEKSLLNEINKLSDKNKIKSVIHVID